MVHVAFSLFFLFYVYGLYGRGDACRGIYRTVWLYLYIVHMCPMSHIKSGLVSCGAQILYGVSSYLASHSRITTDTGPTRTVTPHTKLDYRNTIEPPTTLLHACDPHRISYRHPTQATFCSVPVRASRLGLCTACPPPPSQPEDGCTSPHLPPHPPPHVQLCHHRHWRRLREDN